MRQHRKLQNETARQVVKEVLSQSPISRLKDYRFPAAIAAACLGISVVLGLFTVIAQRSDQNKRTDQLVAQIIRLEDRAEQAEARASDAANQARANIDLTAANNKLLQEVAAIAANVDRLLAAEAESDAQRQPAIEAAIREIIAGVRSGNRDIETALVDIRSLLESNAATLHRVDALIAEAEADAAAEGRRSATLPPEEPAPTTTTTTTTTSTTPPFPHDKAFTLEELEDAS